MPSGIYKRTEEHKRNMSRVRIGKKLPLFTEEHKRKIRIAIQGKKHTPEARLKIGLVNKGRKQSPETVAKRVAKFKGENHWNWQGGITPANIKIRHSLEMRLWRQAILKRDDYTCIWCGQIGGRLEADHIKSFSQFPELRFAIDNGRTLCLPCHKTTDSYLRNYKKPNK